MQKLPSRSGDFLHAEIVGATKTLAAPRQSQFTNFILTLLHTSSEAQRLVLLPGFPVVAGPRMTNNFKAGRCVVLLTTSK